MEHVELPESKIAAGAQVVALALDGAAVLFGIAAVCSVLFPGPSGEWIVFAVLAAYVVNVPIGLASLAVGLFVKRGAARLRRPCLVVSLIVLSLPILTNLIYWWHNHRSW
jgi:hypothetical protein